MTDTANMTISAAQLVYYAQFVDGPALAGVFMNIMLYGVMITQIFFYYTTYTRDNVWLKYYIYNTLINNFGNVNAILYANWLFETEEVLAGFIGWMVQMFYAWRLYVLTRKKWLVIVIMILASGSCLAAIGTAINIALKPFIPNFYKYEAIVLIWLSLAAVTDLIIAVSLVWFLRQMHSDYSTTSTIINQIVQITLSNGLLTAGFALADIIAFKASVCLF
ncbi:uncharacterized protein FIBRA_05545 [Fibroporia radiculosa]|uniref:DUF6534 domain-containing protein n=1 Tax=Fibroporia radiculosa TaxID=599839 RepID=J4H3K7_9APHY|nr:uncharacterized protein FIBRA_05545 [Fibroporia radiculosa]CCM03414.1 predicted protein [Fibroporia radiculosa]